jgi:hypothetical protein
LGCFANYQEPLLLAASFVKDRSMHTFSLWSELPNFTICSP